MQKTDSLGRFTFGPNIFPDSLDTFIEARLDKFDGKEPRFRKLSDNRKIDIKIDNPINSPVFNKTNTLITSNNKTQEANFIKVTEYLEQVNFGYNQKVEQLKTVELDYRKKKRKEEMDKQSPYWTPHWPSSRYDLTTYKTDSLPTTIWDILILTPETGFIEKMTSDGNLVLERFLIIPKLITRDRSEIDWNELYSTPTDEISFFDIVIDILNETIDLHIYSKPGREGRGNKHAIRKPGIIDFTAPGFYIAREFSDKKNLNDFDDMELSEIKTTLHWNPVIKTNTKKPTEVSFQTNNAITDYIIEIEGISTSGEPIHAIKTFNVE